MQGRQKPAQIHVTPEMVEYIRSKSNDLRVATTCEGPLIFSVRTSPPKATDIVMDVAGKKVYVSAIVAAHIKAIDISMLPVCSREARDKQARDRARR
jgi:hypothetical protein